MYVQKKKEVLSCSACSADADTWFCTGIRTETVAGYFAGTCGGEAFYECEKGHAVGWRQSAAGFERDEYGGEVELFEQKDRDSQCKGACDGEKEGKGDDYRKGRKEDLCMYRHGKAAGKEPFFK